MITWETKHSKKHSLLHQILLSYETKFLATGGRYKTVAIKYAVGGAEKPLGPKILHQYNARSATTCEGPENDVLPEI